MPQQSTILIIDDSELNLNLLSHYLNRQGLQAETAASGRDGIATAQRLTPDLILLDVMMQDLDGLTVCQQLKGDSLTRDIPVILITSLTDINDKLAGFEAGAVDYITKPFELKEILARINTHLTISRLQQKMQAEIAHRQQVEAALRASEKRYRSIVEDQTDLICRCLPSGIITFINAAYCRYFHLKQNDILGTSLWAYVYADDLPMIITELISRTPTDPTATLECRCLHRFGPMRWQHWKIRAVFDDSDNLIECQCVIQDITERKQAEEAYRTLVDYSLQGLAILQDNKVIFANHALGKMLDYGVDELLAMSATAVLKLLNQDLPTIQFDTQMSLFFKETQIYNHSGQTRWLEQSITLMEYWGQPAVQIAVVDITDRKEAEFALKRANEELLRQANVDGLTQLANRRRLDEYLAYCWRRCSIIKQSIGLILCDIDHFKQYNDTYGHLAGDDCLRQVAQSVAAIVISGTCLAARYGGEEFAIVLPNVDAATLLDIATRVEENIASLQIPHAGSPVANHITLSIGGAALIPKRTQNVETIIAAADDALYTAKRQGRNRIVIV